MWSKIIRQRRISWLGHLLRLDDNTPAKQALDYALKPVTRKRGRPKLNWLGMIQKQLKDHNLTLENAKVIALDKHSWRHFEYAM